MSQLNEEKKKNCKEVFNFYDTNMDGKLSKEEFDSALKTLGLFIPKKEFDAVVGKIPVLNYQHFEDLVANKMAQKVNKDEIFAAFEFIDPQLTGKAKVSDIKKAFMSMGDPLKENEVDELIQDYLVEGGKVDYRKLVVALVGK